MSRLFDDNASEYLQVGSAPTASYPFSMTCWFNSDDLGSTQTLMCVADKDTPDNYHRLAARGSLAGDPVQVLSYDGAQEDANTTTGYSANTWHHACGIFAANNDRRVYIDGGSKDTGAGATTVADLDNFRIGVTADSTPAFYMSGAVAEAVMWDIILTDNEVWQLAQGYPSWRIHRARIIGFWLPFADRTDRDFSGRGLHLTAFNTPTWMQDPPRVISRYQVNRHHHTDDRGYPWWRTLGKSPVEVRIPRYGFTNFQIPGIV